MDDIKRIIGTFPTGADLWLAVLAIAAMFDRHVPWWVWLLFGLEVAVGITALTGGTITWQKKGA